MQTGCPPEVAVGASAEAPRHPRTRLLGALLAAPCWALLATAALLEPDPRGFGTHEQLGLSPCSMVIRKGLPCPACGMTTSMTAMAHGRLGEAARAQPFGVALFAVTVVGAVVGTAQAIRGRNILRRLRLNLWWLLAGGAGLLIGWALKLAVGLADGTLPSY